LISLFLSHLAFSYKEEEFFGLPSKDWKSEARNQKGVRLDDRVSKEEEILTPLDTFVIAPRRQ